MYNCQPLCDKTIKPGKEHTKTRTTFLIVHSQLKVQFMYTMYSHCDKRLHMMSPNSSPSKGDVLNYIYCLYVKAWSTRTYILHTQKVLGHSWVKKLNYIWKCWFILIRTTIHCRFWKIPFKTFSIACFIKLWSIRGSGLVPVHTGTFICAYVNLHITVMIHAKYNGIACLERWTKRTQVTCT